MSRATDLSRTLSLVLRHQPWMLQLELDDEGWVPLTELLDGLRQLPRWGDVTIGEIRAVVADSAKQRYEIRDGRIRAMYGHSVPGRVDRPIGTPPARLFHGTTPQAAKEILKHGLRPMKRQFVHLSADLEMATMVGGRRAPQPIILHVDTQAAQAGGVVFYEGNERVWLSDDVPAEFISTYEP